MQQRDYNITIVPSMLQWHYNTRNEQSGFDVFILQIFKLYIILN